ncbi:MAG TPA: HD domain-containing protein [Gaiellales bacterium]|nr:HD domain-containing protein [Gaiellales bacterium]
MSSAELERIRANAPVEGAWLVGGSVRDLLMGRPVTDIDLVVDGDPGRAARALARRRGGSPFPLSERHGAWRVVNGGPTVDVAGCRGGSIADDLGQRDFTINAIAMPLDGGDAIDPYGGRDDLRAERIRLVSSQVFDDDPLRLLRLGRIAHELGFVIDGPARGRARERAALADRPSGERIFMEMRRILLLDDPADGIRILDDLDVLEVVLPELAPTRGVEQSGHHHLDVFEHTLQVLDTVADIADNPEHYLREHAAAVAEELARPVGDGLDEAGVLRLAALFHDVAKPATRAVDGAGRISFLGHDDAGAETAAAVLERWRTSAAVSVCCRLLVREHLRLGFMVRQRPLDRRQAHRYLRATDPYPFASVVLSLADRLATRGRRARQRHLRAHAETAVEAVGLMLELLRDPPPPLLRGDQIVALTGASGPAIGALVEALAEEQAAGAVTDRVAAEEFIREQAGALRREHGDVG